MKPLIFLGFFVSAQQFCFGSFGIGGTHGFSQDYFGNIGPADYQVSFQNFKFRIVFIFHHKKNEYGAEYGPADYQVNFQNPNFRIVIILHFKENEYETDGELDYQVNIFNFKLRI